MKEIIRTLRILVPPGGVFEVRGVKPRPISGYFDADHLDEAARQIEALDAAGTVEGLYITLNEVNPDLLARRANRIVTRLPPGAPTTADGDIVRRRWFLVDIDPVRPSGISSTDGEHDRALDTARRIAGFLTEFCGFPDPVMADSGNGAHLLYRIDLPNDEVSTALITRCLQALSAVFGGDGIEIDTAVSNAARLCRLYGTVARKGDSTPDRPHRRSGILEVPEPVETVARESLDRLADLAPEEEEVRRDTEARRCGTREFDLAEWMAEYGSALPAYREKHKAPWRHLYVFDTCPWDPSHRDRSAWVGQLSHGPLAAGCHHNSCSGRGWEDLRELVEPRAERRKPAAREEPRPPAETGGDADYHLTDAGNSERLVRLYGDDIRYCAPLRKWFVWDGRRWEPDETDRMLDLATQTAKSIFHEAAAAPDSESLAKWALRSESLAARRAMIDGATFMVPVRPRDLDAHPYLFNCENGTLDLTTMTLREHRREDLLTKMAGVRYDPDATCPMWIEHLKMVFAGNREMIDAFQEVCGYSLLQHNPEQVMFILWGDGQNGKSETVKTITRIMGDYAVNIEAETLMVSRHGDSGRARPDVLRLRGARFVTVTEPEADAVLSESLVKAFTGDRVVTARPLYGNPIEFQPGGKIFLCTNHKPKIRGRDTGIWRRIWLFPFNVTIPFEKRIRDYGDILYEREAAGIFNWMLEGLRRYIEQKGLRQPDAVKRATQDYRIEMNPVGRFIAERCVVDPRERVEKGDLYAGYREWCEEIGWRPISKKRFGGFVATMFDEARGGNKRYWVGLRLKTAAEIENEDAAVERQTGIDDHDGSGCDTCDTSAQTFPYIGETQKVWENVSHMSPEENTIKQPPDVSAGAFTPPDSSPRDGDPTEKVWVEVKDRIRNEFTGADGATYGPFP
ncbi:MAG: hypothetical protein JRD89_14465, partial [Deltaproteobacteria bacterium]|nr:hypothetical protein [Deltaproteobacteria bacterium]